MEQLRAEEDFMSGWGFTDLGTGSEPVHEFGDLETGPEPVSDVGTEPVLSHSFEDFPDSSFDNLDWVVDVVSNEEPKTPSEQIEPKPDQTPQPKGGMSKRRIKTIASRIYLPLVQKILSMKSKPSNSPSQPKYSTTKPTTKPIRKSFRITSQSTFKPVKPLEQEPILIEETGSSAESSPVKEAKSASTERGSPLISPAQPSLKRKTIPQKTTLQTPIFKRLASIKQAPKQGPSEKEAEEPKSKKAKTSTLPSLNLAKFLQRSIVSGKIMKVAYVNE